MYYGSGVVSSIVCNKSSAMAKSAADIVRVVMVVVVVATMSATADATTTHHITKNIYIYMHIHMAMFYLISLAFQ